MATLASSKRLRNRFFVTIVLGGHDLLGGNYHAEWCFTAHYGRPGMDHGDELAVVDRSPSAGLPTINFGRAYC